MDNFVPYQKLSKKAQRAVNNARRRTWQLNPTTRRPPNPRAYNRKKSPVSRSHKGFGSRAFCYSVGPLACFLYSVGESCSYLPKRLYRERAELKPTA